jgi:hypothetical protein
VELVLVPFLAVQVDPAVDLVTLVVPAVDLVALVVPAVDRVGVALVLPADPGEQISDSPYRPQPFKIDACVGDVWSDL